MHLDGVAVCGLAVAFDRVRDVDLEFGGCREGCGEEEVGEESREIHFVFGIVVWSEREDTVWTE